jgi:hypothetical protein
VRFGGSSNFGQTVESSTVVLDDLDWRYATSSNASPGPRSRPIFKRDPDRDTIWLYGGLSEFSFNSASSFYYGDFWKYSDGHWNRADAATTISPGGCNSPVAAYDTDRQLMVVVCDGNDVFEWNGIEWKTSTVTKHPDARRFFGAVYDPNIRKTLIFGGYDSLGNYRNDTWAWDGTAWTELKPKDKPENRGQMSMWYDPLAKKTIVFSGVGRPNIDQHVTRFEDMWAFDGTNWAKVTMSGPTPGIRFGAQVALDPRDNKVLLFGGLRAIVDPENSLHVDQFYDNDLWQWDGAASKWTEISTENRPYRRQNGAFEFDSASGKFVLFGGFAGNFYFSDTWLFDGQNWTAVQASPVARRRASRK